MSSRVGRSFDPRKAALAVAIAVAAISAGVVLYFVASGSSAPESTVAAAPPSIGEAPPAAPAPSADQGIGETGWARLQFVDKKDPTRIASEMEWQSLSPDEVQRGRSHISEPRFWIYPEDGRTIHVQAKEATVFQPNQQSEPESGRLYGGSLIRVFSAGADGQRRAIDLDKDKPELLIATETITFDSALGEIAMPSACEILTPQLTTKAAHLRLNVNELQRRLELLEAGPGEMRYVLGPDDPRTERAPEDKPAPAAAEAAPAQAASDQPPSAPREDLYRATFTGRVAVRQATREVTGDALDVWARLLDGSLPPGAFPNPNATEDKTATRPASPAAAPTAAAAPTDAPAPVAPRANEDVILTWSGTLVVRPLVSTPPELENANHVALRFTADTTGNVAFADTEAGIAGACVWAGLAVTTQDLTLSGPGPAAVRVTTRGGQEMTVPRLDLNLLSGIGLIRGAGVMHDGDRRLNWAEQCDLVFATRRGVMTGALREATFRGNVTARDDRSDLSGDLFRATFIPAPGSDERDEKVTLAGLVIEGSASGRSEEGAIRADRIDVAFDTAGDGDPQPKIVTAAGNVRASNKEAELRTDFVEATLAPDDRGDLAVTDLRAQGAVRLASEPRGIAAGSDVLQYDGLREIARLTATGQQPAWVSHEGSRIASAVIDLDAAAGRLAVPGAGTFEHEPAPGSTAGPLGDSAMAASWTGSMTADDATGVIECLGDVVVSTDPEATQVYRATAPYLRLEIEPAAAPTPAESAEPRRRRRLLRAELASGDEAAPALVESRTYAAAPAGTAGERRLDQFLRLTGARIIADDTAGRGGVITVPGPGRAAVYDGRAVTAAANPEGAKAATPAAPFTDGEFRGSALFTWNGSMDLDRSTELLTMRRGVRLVHRPLTDEPPTTLECERLRAELLFKSGPAARSSASADLVRADATGAVYVESSARRLMADGVMYDSSRRLVEATASDGNRVTLYDDQRATVTSAARLRWDLAADRIEIERPSPVIAPVTPR